MATVSGNSRQSRLPKLCGADIELGNFVLGSQGPGDTGREASRALLREFDGLPLPSTSSGYGTASIAPRQTGQAHSQGWGYYAMSDVLDTGSSSEPFNPQDWGRKFLPGNGGCVYIDLDHLELCLPEVISAWDHVAVWHAMLRLTRHSLIAANRRRPENRQLQVLVNNSDGHNNSYGSHLNFLITRRAWDNLFDKKMHQLIFLATYQVSSIIFSGQGKVGSENGALPVYYQLSQRADFLETLLGPQTTFHRPIVNSRDEPLCGRQNNSLRDSARLHIIFFDNTLSHIASLLKVGVTQIILSMIEADCVNPKLLLDDPVRALSWYSHDPTLKARAATVMGQRLSALELQSLFFEEATRFAARGGFEGVVPRAEEILHLWGDTLQKLKHREFTELSRRIDWILKLQIIARAMGQQPELTWNSAQIRYLDHLYSCLDENEGLYWIYEKNGFVEKAVSEEQIARFLHNPPEDTRAYTRAMLLRSADPAEVDTIDWDSITFNVGGRDIWPDRRTVDLAHPLDYSRERTEQCFRNSDSLGEILDALEAIDPGSGTRRFPEAVPRGGGSILTH